MITGIGKLQALGRRLDPFAVDCVAAAALLAAMEVVLWTTRDVRVPLVHALWGAVVVGVLAARRRWLLQASAVAVLATALVVVAFGPGAVQGPAGSVGAVILVLVAYGSGAFLEGSRAVAGLAMTLAISSTIALTSPTQVVANLLWDAPISGVLPWLVGRIMRERSERARAARERAERLDSQHEYHERAASLGERARLAREIHDVIAHSVSVMVIQAAGARAVMDRDPDRAGASLRSVERAGRDALAEMRRLLGVLGERGELRVLTPQPGLEDLNDLVARMSAAGLATTVRVSGDPVAVPAGLSLCAYRVVQEALTNALKHAGRSHAEVLVRWHPDTLEIEVVDDGPPALAPPWSDLGGHGIAGMRERVGLHGGTVASGPGPDGGFAVRVSIPLLERMAA